MSRSDAKRVVVLGAGRVGSLIARDLADDGALSVTVFDRDESALAAFRSRPEIATSRLDLADPSAVAGAAKGAALVVGAVPGALGLATLRAAIEAGAPTVDISFSPEDPRQLDGLARERGVPVVVDCGVAPGLSNWLSGRSTAELDDIAELEILVGGLPFRRVWPFEYRSVFSPTDVIEEYTRPCRMRIEGRDVVVPALTGIENVDFPRVGTLEAFFTDGLRTLLDTIPAPTLREKTLRYPGHAERMAMLRDTGFFDEAPREIGGRTVIPRELTEALLFDAWRPEPDERELTVLRVQARGTHSGQPKTIVWELFDETDAATGATSMARTTGFPCAIVGRMLVDGAWSEPGVHPPEVLGRDRDLTRRLLGELARRRVQVERDGRPATA